MSRFLYYVKQGFLQIIRNRGMSLASIFSILAMLMILGVFFTVSVNLNLFTEAAKDNYNSVEMFLKDSVTKEEADGLIQLIKEKSGVEDAAYRTKDQALDIMKERWGENGFLLDTYRKNNPLPNSIVITVKELTDADSVCQYIKTLDGVESIQYYKDTVDKITAISNFIQVAALVIMAFLVIVCTIVVSNTVKLTVFARSREIQIMKYVGATNWFIRGPFLIEGILIGLIGAGISTLVMRVLYENVVNKMSMQISAIVSTPLISPSYMTGNLVIIFLALGASIGAWGSIVSIRRFLDT